MFVLPCAYLAPPSTAIHVIENIHVPQCASASPAIQIQVSEGSDKYSFLMRLHTLATPAKNGKLQKGGIGKREEEIRAANACVMG
jgi:hypothetical protein